MFVCKTSERKITCLAIYGETNYFFLSAMQKNMISMNASSNMLNIKQKKLVQENEIGTAPRLTQQNNKILSSATNFPLYFIGL